MNNDILLSRKILQWGWYKDANTFRVFLHLLLTANWKDGEYLGHPIRRGQCVFGRQKLASALCLTERQVRVSLEHLKMTGELTIKTTNKYSIATIVKYSDYQLSPIENDQQNDQQNVQQMTSRTSSKRPAECPADDHIQFNKSSNSGNSVSQYISTLSRSPEWNEAFLAFAEMRKAIKHNLTVHAAELIVGELEKLSTDEAMQIEILNQSVVHSWQGVFALKNREPTLPAYDDSKDIFGR